MSVETGHAPPGNGLRLALLAVAPVLAAFVLGNLATFPNLPWYETLAKPSFNPPNWLFGPAWTVLYILMAIALFRILRLPKGTPGRDGALLAFGLQIVLNAGWSFAFFAAHSPPYGLFVIAGLVIMVVVNMVAFGRLDRIAGLCFVPYVAWVAFAMLLNGAIMMLNP